jgi:glycosyltransferase involved in cell wall biosynthesis/predicted O-methyltransferase YrrM
MKKIHSNTSLYDFGGGSPLPKCYLMAYLASHFKLQNYVEIGVYKGKSLFSVAQAFMDNNGNAYGIDPYCLSEAKEYDLEEGFRNKVNTFLEGIDFEAMYNNVLINNEKYGLSDVVQIIRKTSNQAVLDFEKIKIDMLHIDGNHDRKNVQADIDHYAPLVIDGGIIVFDTINWASVKECYEQFKKKNLVLFENNQFGILMKKNKAQKNLDTAAIISRKLKNMYSRLLETENQTVMKRPTINVGVLAYNHEKYIVECIDSIVKQRGDFDLKIIICDDNSTDQTTSMIDTYIKNTVMSKNITIEHLISNVNLGMVKNLKRVIRSCQGSKYMALVDGDDYWIHDHKIQRHINFMEIHPECAISFDSIIMDYENERKQELYNMQQEAIGDIFTTLYILERYIIGNISCGFYYGPFIEQIPDALFEMFVGDWMLNIFCSQLGDIGHIKSVMTLYRKHDHGIWSSQDAYDRNKKTIECIDDYNRFLNYTYDVEFSKTRHGFAHRRDERYLESYDLLIIDEDFPNPQNVKYEQFISYLQNIHSMKILTTAFLETIHQLIIDFKRKFPETEGKLSPFIALDYINTKLLYFDSLTTAASLIDVVEKRKFPFIFALYNDISFEIDNATFNKRLKRVLQSPCLKKIIVAEKKINDYLLDNNLAKPEQIEYEQGYPRVKLLKDYIQSDSDSNVEISMDKESNNVDSIDVENLVTPKETSSKSVPTEFPDVVKNYNTPKNIGKELLSYQLKYGGNYYKLPAPIAEFEKNGWVLLSNSDIIVAGKRSAVGIELRKDNQILRTQIINYSEKGAPIGHCFITYIEYYNYGAEISLELPKGITERSTIEEVFKAYGDPTEVDESTNFKYYTYGKTFEGVTFVTSGNEIVKIEVTNYSPNELD